MLRKKESLKLFPEVSGSVKTVKYAVMCCSCAKKCILELGETENFIIKVVELYIGWFVWKFRRECNESPRKGGMQ